MIFCSIFTLIIILFLIINPNKYINSAFNGILIWAKAVLPSLFPFFFLTKLLTELGGIKILANSLQKFMQKCFHVNGIGSYVFLTSIMSGYPVGAKITSELYEKQISEMGAALFPKFREVAERLNSLILDKEEDYWRIIYTFSWKVLQQSKNTYHQGIQGDYLLDTIASYTKLIG